MRRAGPAALVLALADCRTTAPPAEPPPAVAGSSAPVAGNVATAGERPAAQADAADGGLTFPSPAQLPRARTIPDADTIARAWGLAVHWGLVVGVYRSEYDIDLASDGPETIEGTFTVGLRRRVQGWSLDLTERMLRDALPNSGTFADAGWLGLKARSVFFFDGSPGFAIAVLNGACEISLIVRQPGTRRELLPFARTVVAAITTVDGKPPHVAGCQPDD